MTQSNTASRQNLIGMSREELKEVLSAQGLESFRAKQVWQWVYHHGITDFEQMSNIAKPVRALLAEQFTVARPGVDKEQLSIDGTRKWLLRFADENQAEMVFIPEDDRGTLCISSQVGCTLTCPFCHTGTQRLVRNLTPEEIVGQVMLARDALLEWPRHAALLPPRGGAAEHKSEGRRAMRGGGDIPISGKAPPRLACAREGLSRQLPLEGGAVKRKLTNIVLMGMGEPLFNYENVAKAMQITMDGEGLALSKRRITLSTSGIVPEIIRCGEEIGVNLAISLHAVTDDLRNEIVPINRKWPLEQLMEACRTYPGASNARRITFEYVMLKGVNDSDADARALVALLEGIPAKINLIPFNPWPGAPYECSSNNRIHRFARIVGAAGYSSPIRTPRGRDILAACGQLKSASERASPSSS